MTNNLLDDQISIYEYLLANCGHLTVEEMSMYREMLERNSTATGVNIWDILEEAADEEKL